MVVSWSLIEAKLQQCRYGINVYTFKTDIRIGLNASCLAIKSIKKHTLSCHDKNATINKFYLTIQATSKRLQLMLLSAKRKQHSRGASNAVIPKSHCMLSSAQMSQYSFNIQFFIKHQENSQFTLKIDLSKMLFCISDVHSGVKLNKNSTNVHLKSILILKS